MLKHKIRRQAYFGGTFIGPHVKLLTENAVQIFKEAGEAMKGAVEEDKHEQVDKIIDQMTRFFSVLGVVCEGMRRTVPLSAEERALFRKAATKTGDIWREMHPGDPITPKLHVLEKHAADQLDNLFCLGIFSEDSIEKEHHIDSILNDVFSNVGSYVVRSTGMESRRGMSRDSGVKIQANVVNASRKRKGQGSYVECEETKNKTKVKLEQQTGAMAEINK